jgi:magnesium transporter
MPVEIREEKGFTWINVLDPSRDELTDLSKKYKFHQLSLIDSLDPDHLPKYEMMHDVVFIIVRVYDKDAPPDGDTIQELTSKVAIFAGDDFLITIHRQELECLGTACHGALAAESPGVFEFLCNLLHQVLITFEKPGLKLASNLDYFESKIFLNSRTPAILKDLYHLKRKAAVIKRLLNLSRQILEKIASHMENPEVQYPQLQDLNDFYTRVETIYDNVNESVNNLLNLYINLSSQKTTEVMRILTVFSVFFMPLTFIVGIYGMNFHYMPELEMKIGYPSVMILMACVTLVIYMWFRKKGWL